MHHINDDKFDNRIDNLEIRTPKSHSVHHNQKYPLTKVCVVCGAEFTPAPTKRKRAQTCSRECFRVLAGTFRRGKFRVKKADATWKRSDNQILPDCQ